MVSEEKVLDQEKVTGLVKAITDEAVAKECSYLEIAQACRAVMHASLEMIGGNAREILLREESESPR